MVQCLVTLVVVDPCSQLVQEPRLESLTVFQRGESLPHASLQGSCHTDVEKIALGGDNGFAKSASTPCRQFMDYKGVAQQIEVLVDCCSRYLSIVRDIGEVDDGCVTLRGNV